MWRRSKVREAKEEERQAAAEAAAAAAVVTDTTITDGKQQPDQIEQHNQRHGMQIRGCLAQPTCAFRVAVVAL